jgi:hypothetical protein
VALTCIEELLKWGCAPDLYLPLEEKSQTITAQPTQLLLKDRYSKPYLYKPGPGMRPLSQIRTSVYEISRIGGLTEIWGGVMLPNHPFEECINNSSRASVKSLSEEILTRRGYRGRYSLITKYLESQKPEAISSMDIPLFQANNRPEIWSARNDLIEILKHPSISRFGPALKLINKGSKTQVLYYESPTNSKLSPEYDWIFVAAGPIGDAKLILDSYEKLRAIEIKDTNVVYSLRFSRHKHRNFEQLIPVTIRAYFSSTYTAYSQEYLLSNQLISSLRFKSLQKLFVFLSPLIRNWITVDMNFFPQRESEPMTISRVEDQIVIKSGKNSKLCVFKALSQRKFKTFSRRIGIRPHVGSGQHSGSFVTNNFEGAVVMSDGKILIPRASFVGASSLSALPTGPITLVAMVNALDITRRILAELE